MKTNLKVVLVIAGTVLLPAAFPFLIWKLTRHTGAARPTGNDAGQYLAKEQMAFAGYMTPEAALQTIAWTAINGDSDKVFACFSPEMQAGITNEPNGRRKFNADIKRHAQQLKGLQIMARKMLTDDKAELKIKLNITSRRRMVNLFRIFASSP